MMTGTHTTHTHTWEWIYTRHTPHTHITHTAIPTHTQTCMCRDGASRCAQRDMSSTHTHTCTHGAMCTRWHHHHDDHHCCCCARVVLVLGAVNRHSPLACIAAHTLRVLSPRRRDCSEVGWMWDVSVVFSGEMREICVCVCVSVYDCVYMWIQWRERRTPRDIPMCGYASPLVSLPQCVWISLIPQENPPMGWTSGWMDCSASCAVL